MNLYCLCYIVIYIYIYIYNMILIVEAWAIAYQNDGKHLLSTSQSGNINIWDLESGKKEKTIENQGKFAMSIAIVYYQINIIVLF